MDYRPLRCTGVRVSPICLGALEVIVTDGDGEAIDRIIPTGACVSSCCEAERRVGVHRW